MTAVVVAGCVALVLVSALIALHWYLDNVRWLQTHRNAERDANAAAAVKAVELLESRLHDFDDRLKNVEFRTASPRR